MQVVEDKLRLIRQGKDSPAAAPWPLNPPADLPASIRPGLRVASWNLLQGLQREDGNLSSFGSHFREDEPPIELPTRQERSALTRHFLPQASAIVSSDEIACTSEESLRSCEGDGVKFNVIRFVHGEYQATSAVEVSFSRSFAGSLDFGKATPRSVLSTFSRLSNLAIRVRSVKYDLDTAMALAETVKNWSVMESLPLVSTNPSPMKYLMIASHYDAAIRSPGAADALSGVGTAMEALRNMLHEPHKQWHRGLMLNLNGNEESYLQAASGFVTSHPWSPSVAAAINLEAIGSSGPEHVLQYGRSSDFFRKAYKNVPRPRIHSIVEAVYTAGVVPALTDFNIWNAAGIGGLELAWSAQGYYYHTSRDTVANIEPGSIQHTGDNLKAIIVAALLAEDLEKPDVSCLSLPANELAMKEKLNATEDLVLPLVDPKGLTSASVVFDSMGHRTLELGVTQLFILSLLALGFYGVAFRRIRTAPGQTCGRCSNCEEAPPSGTAAWCFMNIVLDLLLWETLLYQSFARSCLYHSKPLLAILLAFPLWSVPPTTSEQNFGFFRLTPRRTAGLLAAMLLLSFFVQNVGIRIFVILLRTAILYRNEELGLRLCKQGKRRFAERVWESAIILLCIGLTAGLSSFIVTPLGVVSVFFYLVLHLTSAGQLAALSITWDDRDGTQKGYSGLTAVLLGTGAALLFSPLWAPIFQIVVFDMFSIIGRTITSFSIIISIPYVMWLLFRPTIWTIPRRFRILTMSSLLISCIIPSSHFYTSYTPERPKRLEVLHFVSHRHTDGTSEAIGHGLLFEVNDSELFDHLPADSCLDLDLMYTPESVEAVQLPIGFRACRVSPTSIRVKEAPPPFSQSYLSSTGERFMCMESQQYPEELFTHPHDAFTSKAAMRMGKELAKVHFPKATSLQEEQPKLLRRLSKVESNFDPPRLLYTSRIEGDVYIFDVIFYGPTRTWIAFKDAEIDIESPLAPLCQIGENASYKILLSTDGAGKSVLAFSAISTTPTLDIATSAQYPQFMTAELFPYRDVEAQKGFWDFEAGETPPPSAALCPSSIAPIGLVVSHDVWTLDASKCF